MGRTLLIWFFTVATGLLACSKAEQAADLARFTLYYAQVGTELGQVEQGFASIPPKISEGAMDASKRPAVFEALNQHIAQLDAVVQRHTPSNAAAHPGHQAALRMIQRRRVAVAQLQAAWGPTADADALSNAIQPFMTEWMAAQQDFMNTAGQESQRVFGTAAGQAQQGAQQ